MLTIFYYELEFTPSRIAFSDDSAAARSMGGKFAEDGTEGGGEGGEEEMKAIPDPISSRLGLIEKKAQPEKVVHVPPRRIRYSKRAGREFLSKIFSSYFLRFDCSSTRSPGITNAGEVSSFKLHFPPFLN